MALLYLVQLVLRIICGSVRAATLAMSWQGIIASAQRSGKMYGLVLGEVMMQTAGVHQNRAEGEIMG